MNRYQSPKFSTFDSSGGKQVLADGCVKPITGTGFSEAEVRRQYDIAYGFFPLPLKKKGELQYKCNFASGEAQYPFFRAYQAEIEDSPGDILTPPKKALELAAKLFTLFAFVLELPEDYFSPKHRYEDASGNDVWYMSCRPRSAAEGAKVAETWPRAYTDLGSLTLLWSQNAVVGDTLDVWSASYLKSTTHRGVQPLPDQFDGNRLDFLNFPAPSRLLMRLGLVDKRYDDAEPVKGLKYVHQKAKNYHNHVVFLTARNSF
ncbi:uncharacterized protein BCR38DRAFT_459712 [Pseudomassariella vexata]|uniref:Clavaminate synthase-like protein n=1 Tax=Pseudomassariella vexata TaxID=1141098 RepID=A0A1Y2DN75_9PEZI|nr:uncharacterized protein BCR38DRAFT_459712 [Pseudomassariella vexata]ORY60700.1 hypothetical protein BCR38DRAFT_459712 [Pseudomassariella vexata]